MTTYKSSSPRGRVHFFKQGLLVAFIAVLPLVAVHLFPLHFKFDTTTYLLICGASLIGGLVRNASVSRISEIAFDRENQEVQLRRVRLFNQSQKRSLLFKDLKLQAVHFSDKGEPVKKKPILYFERGGKELESLSFTKDGFLAETLTDIVAAAKEMGIPVKYSR